MNNSSAIQTETKYAGFGLRLVAHGIDYLLLLLPHILFWWLAVKAIAGLADLITYLTLYATLILFPSVILTLLYYAYTTSKFGATLGKVITGLKVVDSAGNKLSLKCALFRHSIGTTVSNLLGGIGYLWIIKDPKKQGWHDQLTGSYVIKLSSNSFLIGLVIIFALFFIEGFMAIESVSTITDNKLIQRDLKDIEATINKIQEGEKLNMENKPEIDDSNQMNIEDYFQQDNLPADQQKVLDDFKKQYPELFENQPTLPSNLQNTF